MVKLSGGHYIRAESIKSMHCIESSGAACVIVYLTEKPEIAENPLILPHKNIPAAQAAADRIMRRVNGGYAESED